MKKQKNLHNNAVAVFWMNMNYNYEKVCLFGNKNNWLVNETHMFRIMHHMARSHVYLIQGISFN